MPVGEPTPGPWECIGGEFHKDPEMAGLVSYFVKLPGGPVISKANADLIAAAPDLLAALRGLFSDEYDDAEFTLVDGPGGTMEEERAGEVVDRFRDAARAALARALGNPQQRDGEGE